MNIPFIGRNNKNQIDKKPSQKSSKAGAEFGSAINSQKENELYYTNKKLKGSRGLQTLREMAKGESSLKVALKAIKSHVQKTDITVHGGSEKLNTFLNQVLAEMDYKIEGELGKIMTMVEYGFSVSEIVYKEIGNNKLGWKKFGFRPQGSIIDNWQYDKDRRVTGVKQVLQRDEVFLPIDKILVFSNDFEEERLQGESELVASYRFWKKKLVCEQLEGIGIDRDLAGLPVMYAPPEIFFEDAPPEDKAKLTELESIIQNLRRDEQEGILLPNEKDENGDRLYTMELLSAGGKRQFDIDKVVQRMDCQMLTSLMAQFMMTGQNSGAYNLHESQVETFVSSLNEYIERIETIFNKYAVERLMMINGYENKIEYPRLNFKRLNTKDLTSLAERLVKYSSAGLQLFPNEELEQFIKEKEGLPSDNKGVDYADMFNS